MSPPSGNIPSNPSPALQAVLKCFLGFSENDFTLLEPILAESYTHEVLPKSMGFPVEAKEQWLGRVGKSRHLLKEFKLIVHEIIEAPGKIIVHGSNDGVSTTGLPYTNEYNFIFDVVEVDGQWKITHVKEFVDSQFSIKFHAEEVKRQQELAK